jgi:Helix-turn-helix domain
MRVKERNDDVVLLGEFARAARISRATAYTWARASEIPAQFRGGRYQISRHDFTAAERGRHWPQCSTCT